MKKILIIFLFQIHVLLGQPLKNGKFYCKVDTSRFYATEEWTLKLFAVNIVELTSIKTSDINRNPTKKTLKKMKAQFYTGLWEQKGDTIFVGLDFNADSVKKIEDYELKFILKENNLFLLKTAQIKNFDYSDMFYGQTLWVKKNFRQSRKPKIRVKF